MKNNRGVTLADVAVSIIILCMFIGIIGNLFYQIALNSNLTKYNAIATHYAVKLAEHIDVISFDNVNDTYLNNTLIPMYNVNENFTISASVKDYNPRGKSFKKDILKIVTITVDYNFFDKNETYIIQKLKVKEF